MAPETDQHIVKELTITDATEGFRGFVTEQIEEPSWGNNTGLEFSQYELHLFYESQETQILYEFTTDESLANQLRNGLFSSLGGRIPGRRLAKLLQTDQNPQYHITGLANSSLPSGKLPAYKTFSGDDVQGAVQPSDGRVYTTGHVLASLEQDTTRGISADNGRVWEQGRKQIEDFVDWCDELDANLRSGSQTAGIQGLEFLNTLQPIDEFETEPILAIQNPRLLEKRLSYIPPNGTSSTEINSMVFEVADFDKSQPSILEFTVCLELEDSNVSVDAKYNVGSDTWSGDITEHTFVLDQKQRTQELLGNSFFSEFPPFIYTDDANSVIGGEKRPVEPSYESLQDVIDDSNPIDWSDCDISEEEPPNLDGDSDPRADGLWSNQNDNNSVHQKLVSHIRKKTDEQILFYDHPSGEIADVIEILPEGPSRTDTPTIRFFHCKGTSDSDADAKANLGEVKDVQQQVLRNTNFIMNSRLPKRIEYRESGDTLQHFITDPNKFNQFAQDFRPSKWEYEVYIVHPGFDPDLNPDIGVEGERTESNVNTLLCVCYEWVRDAGAEFIIWGGTDN